MGGIPHLDTAHVARAARDIIHAAIGLAHSAVGKQQTLAGERKHSPLDNTFMYFSTNTVLEDLRTVTNGVRERECHIQQSEADRLESYTIGTLEVISREYYQNKYINVVQDEVPQETKDAFGKFNRVIEEWYRVLGSFDLIQQLRNISLLEIIKVEYPTASSLEEYTAPTAAAADARCRADYARDAANASSVRDRIDRGVCKKGVCDIGRQSSPYHVPF